MSSLLLIILFNYLTYTIVANDVTYVNTRHLLAGVHVPAQQESPSKSSVEILKHAEDKEEEAEVNVKSNNNAKAAVDTKPVNVKPQPPQDIKTKTTSSNATTNFTKSGDHRIIKTTEMESGALLRGVSVVVVLTMIVIIYLGLKTYCGKKMKHPAMVSKYGVRTRRSDIEMTPLPLDDDEEDETLFEVNNAR